MSILLSKAETGKNRSDLVYPFVKMPPFIYSIKNLLPTPEKLLPVKRVKPELVNPPKLYQPKKEESSGMGIIGILFGLVMLIVSFYMGIIFGGIFSLLIIIVTIIGKISSDNSRASKYEEKLRQYQRDLAQQPTLNKKAEEDYKKEMIKWELDCKKYDDDVITYHKHLEEINKPDAINEYRRAELMEELKQIKKPERRNDIIDVKKGVSENYFVNELNKILDYCIVQDLFLQQIDEKYRPYCPDIVLIDKMSNLHIDIEIDEPYVGLTGEPIHFIGCNDTHRDNYFVENGWIVIRFAEEQIIKNTRQCIDFIIYIMDLFLRVDSDLKEIKSYLKSNSFLVSRWTKDESELMAEDKYREKYLGIDRFGNSAIDRIKFPNITNALKAKREIGKITNVNKVVPLSTNAKKTDVKESPAQKITNQNEARKTSQSEWVKEQLATAPANSVLIVPVFELKKGQFVPSKEFIRPSQTPGKEDKGMILICADVSAGGRSAKYKANKFEDATSFIIYATRNGSIEKLNKKYGNSKWISNARIDTEYNSEAANPNDLDQNVWYANQACLDADIPCTDEEGAVMYKHSYMETDLTLSVPVMPKEPLIKSLTAFSTKMASP